MEILLENLVLLLLITSFLAFIDSKHWVSAFLTCKQKSRIFLNCILSLFLTIFIIQKRKYPMLFCLLLKNIQIIVLLPYNWPLNQLSILVKTRHILLPTSLWLLFLLNRFSTLKKVIYLFLYIVVRSWRLHKLCHSSSCTLQRSLKQFLNFTCSPVQSLVIIA